jgi:hypothetical protein
MAEDRILDEDIGLADAGEAEVRLAVAADHLNFMGSCHGGVVFALTRGGQVDEPASTTTTTTTTTTTAPVPAGPTAPLTGLVVDDTDAAAIERLDRPALVGKIDNAPEAMPQIGLDRADVAIELKVEGISRYMAVVHSQDVAELGPIRSARTSDPDLLAMFVRPLFAWSGGNPKVIGQIRSTPWIQSLTPDQVRGAYSRSSAKRAPHNLIADVERLYRAADEPPAVPVPVVGYLTRDADPGGAPVPGLSVSVGASSSTYVWDADAERWFRWAGSTPQRVRGGEQVSAANVVVLATPHTASSADSRSPEAQTLGSGSAWVFTGDTGPNPALWARLAHLPVAALVIETAFGDDERELAGISRHLCPALLREELAQLREPADVFITHIKPGEVDAVMSEIGAHDSPHRIQALVSGQVMVVGG